MIKFESKLTYFFIFLFFREAESKLTWSYLLQLTGDKII